LPLVKLSRSPVHRIPMDKGLYKSSTSVLLPHPAKFKSDNATGNYESPLVQWGETSFNEFYINLQLSRHLHLAEAV